MSGNFGLPAPSIDGPFMRRVRERQRHEAQQRLEDARRIAEAQQEASRKAAEAKRAAERQKAQEDAERHQADSEARRRRIAEVTMYRLQSKGRAKTREMIAAIGIGRIDAIAAEVCKAHGITKRDLLSDRRTKPLILAKQEVCYRAITETMMSYPAVGRWLRRDHTTVMHGVRRHAERYGLPIPGEGT